MRILHVTPTYLPAVRYGGPIYSVHNLCRALVERGHHVEVLTTNADGERESDVPLGESVSLDGVIVRYFRSRWLRRLYWSPDMANALKDVAHTFDLVHGHSVYLWPTWAAERAAIAARRSYVLSPRGALVKDLIRRRSRFAKTAWITLIERSNIERASAIHATSETEASELARFGWRLPPVAIIGNGVEEPAEVATGATPGIAGALGRKSTILYFGRLSWKKGLERLVRAVALLERGDLVIAGTDDENCGPTLADLANELGIGHRVRVLARTVQGADKERLFSETDLFVLPSYSENFGNTVLEAMIRGLPVVVTDGVGAKSIVAASQGGSVSGREPAELAEAMRQILRNPDLARDMGARGRSYVRMNFGWPQIASEMENLYSRVRAAERGPIAGRVA
jgi:glycosyltransferase involved in cell wall biosynthesis